MHPVCTGTRGGEISISNTTPAGTVSDWQSTQLAITYLEGLATELIDNSLANTSRRSYSSAQKQYLQFCERLKFNPLPATEWQLVLFVAEVGQRLCHSSVRSYLSAIRHMQITAGLGDPLVNSLQLHRVVARKKL